jgi:tetratricopeptide (TPR) repeat protein
VNSSTATAAPPASGPARLPRAKDLGTPIGVLAEPTLDDSRLVLWLPAGREGGARLWERISNVPRAEIIPREGLYGTPAVLLAAREHGGGIVGRLLRPFRRVAEDRALVLPDGRQAERCGDKRTDLLFVWGDAGSAADEARIRAAWPETKEVRRVGENLFLAIGVSPPPQPEEPGAQLPPAPCPIPVTERLLDDARRRGDRRGQAIALTDLGILLYHDGELRRSAALLEEAVTIARELGDRPAEKDALGQLGLTAFALGQPARAQTALTESLRLAREAGDPFAEKLTLAQLGLIRASAGDPAGARDYFEQALAFAKELDDNKHQPELLWYLSIQYDQLGDREQAIAYAQATVDFLKSQHKPQAAWYAHYLERYRNQGKETPPGSTPRMGNGPHTYGGSMTTDNAAAPGAPAASPGLLNMAFSASKSMAQFLGSGLKTVPPAVHQQRTRACAGCEHHTGVRCRVCGCFTAAKTRMAHEECPLGKWPAERT